MKLPRRRLLLLAISIGVIVLVTLVAAPSNNKINSGSTYGRAPNGYGAWYAYMVERGTPIQRWQKPFSKLENNSEITIPITLLQIQPRSQPSELSDQETTWVRAGNTLIVLGVFEPVSRADFTTWQNSDAGKVKIDTRRRKKNSGQSILEDEFGAVVWQKDLGKGKVIYAITPHLAANAYQDYPSNYKFLAQLVSRQQQPIWVDEYLHGYKDAEVIQQEYEQSLWNYLAQTPLLPLSIQVIVILLVAIWQGLSRFGKPVPLSTPVVENSQAYIDALAKVLAKANCHEFVVEVIGREEQIQLQKTLGLGKIPTDHPSLIAAWQKQTSKSPQELQQLLQLPSKQNRLSHTQLRQWMAKWEQIRTITKQK